MRATTFSAGDKVIYKDVIGTISAIYPDGIHFVRMPSGSLVAVMQNDLSPVQRESNPSDEHDRSDWQRGPRGSGSGADSEMYQSQHAQLPSESHRENDRHGADRRRTESTR